MHAHTGLKGRIGSIVGLIRKCILTIYTYNALYIYIDIYTEIYFNMHFLSTYMLPIRTFIMYAHGKTYTHTPNITLCTHIQASVPSCNKLFD